MPYELVDIALRSIVVSGSAAILATTWSIPIGIYLSISDNELSRIAISIVNILIGVPTVLIGLLLYLLLSRSGPLGFLNLLYTPYAIIIGQSILVTPLIISFVYEIVSSRSRELMEMLKTYNASTRDMIEILFEEYEDRMFGSALIGFERALGELGIALMLGGNIRGVTRVFTTTIALEVQKGMYELAIQLGIILLIMDMVLISIIRLLGWRR